MHTIQTTHNGVKYYVDIWPTDLGDFWAILSDSSGETHQLSFTRADAAEQWPPIFYDIELGDISLLELIRADDKFAVALSAKIDQATQGDT